MMQPTTWSPDVEVVSRNSIQILGPWGGDRNGGGGPLAVRLRLLRTRGFGVRAEAEAVVRRAIRRGVAPRRVKRP